MRDVPNDSSVSKMSIIRLKNALFFPPISITMREILSQARFSIHRLHFEQARMRSARFCPTLSETKLVLYISFEL